MSGEPDDEEPEEEPEEEQGRGHHDRETQKTRGRGIDHASEGTRKTHSGESKPQGRITRPDHGSRSRKR